MKGDRVVCSAVKDVDGEVWLGKRHSDCIWLCAQFGRTGKGPDRKIGEQGFWVIGNGSIGRFVDRYEAGRIALMAAQIERLPEDLHPNDSDLYSEDLW